MTCITASCRASLKWAASSARGFPDAALTGAYAEPRSSISKYWF